MTDVESLIRMIGDPSTADEAAEMLYDLGVSVLVELEAAMLDAQRPANVREFCAECMGAVVPEGVSRLLALLVECDDEVADLAAWGLRWNRAPTIVEPRLTALLQSDDAGMRARAVRAFRFIDADVTRCPPQMFDTLRDPSAYVHEDALRFFVELVDVGLERFGIADRRDDLRAAAAAAEDDRDPNVQAAASGLLAILDG